MLRDTSIVWLVAEDSEDDFFLLQRACASASSPPKLQRTRNGAEAQQYLLGDGVFGDRDVYPLPAMVVSDLKMPVMDGLELLAWLQGHRWEPIIRFVLLTSSDAQSDRDRARGADEYLLKPGKYADLVTTVVGISERNENWMRPPLRKLLGDRPASTAQVQQAVATSTIAGCASGLDSSSSGHELTPTHCQYRNGEIRSLDIHGFQESRR